jgi:RNA polymerase sigma-70 factor (ECF subfamily)
MDDAEAVRECLAGDRQAFRHLVNRYQTRALAHARALVGGEAGAADAAQEAFLDAFRSLARFDLEREFYPWFYVLLRNRCFKQRSRPGTRHLGVLASDHEQESAPATEPEAAGGASREEALDLRRAISRLDPSDRELVLLKHLEGWTYEELSARLGIPRGTVMSRLFHARRRLQSLISGEES